MIALTIAFSSLSSPAALLSDPGKMILPGEPGISYVGRWEKSPRMARCSWPASTLVLQTNSSNVGVVFDPDENNRWQVEVDGKPTLVLGPIKNRTPYTVASNLPTRAHTIRLIKRTESMSGPSTFRGFQVDKQSSVWLAKRRRPHRIQIVGDSISAGFGLDGKSQNEKYSFEIANAYLTAGQLASRELGAACTVIAWSGKKLWPDNSLVDIFDLVVPADSRTSQRVTSTEDNDVVVINLATNDFGTAVPNEAGWTSAYLDFLSKIRSKNLGAMIYICSGPMMSDSWPPKVKALTTLNGYLNKIYRTFSLNDRKIKVLEFGTQDVSKDGVGAAWHPNAATNRKMAKVLVSAIRRDLKWQ